MCGNAYGKQSVMLQKDVLIEKKYFTKKSLLLTNGKFNMMCPFELFDKTVT